MALNINVEIKQTKNGKFNSIISWESKGGKGHASASHLRDDPMSAISGAFEPLLVMSPNLTQEEIDNHYERYP